MNRLREEAQKDMLVAQEEGQLILELQQENTRLREAAERMRAWGGCFCHFPKDRAEHYADCTWLKDLEFYEAAIQRFERTKEEER